MTMRFKTQNAESDSLGKATLTKLNTEFALLPTPIHIDETMSAGQLLAAASKGAIAIDPVAELKRLRVLVAIRLKEATSPILAAKKVSEWLLLAAEYVENGTALPDAPAGVPPHIEGHIRSLRTYCTGSVLSHADASNRLREAGERGLELTADALRDFRRFPSAAAVACATQGALYADRCGRQAMAEGLRKRADRLKAAHRKAFERFPSQRRRGY